MAPVSEPIGPNTMLPAHRTRETLETADGFELVAELALPLTATPRATLILVHPLPTAGGSMDSHLYRKIAWRLPALADLAVLRFNTRGTSSEFGTSQGRFDFAGRERFDLDAAIQFARAKFLPRIWLVGWSFGSDVVLLYGNQPGVEGAILLSPPLLRADDAALAAWNAGPPPVANANPGVEHAPGKPLVVLVPALDDYLRPVAARARFNRVKQAEIIAVPDAHHLWTGERFVSIVLNEIVGHVLPGSPPLPDTWPAA